MTEALEKETEQDLSIKTAGNIFTIFIELSQNMMNYSKKVEKEGFDPKGLIIVGKKKLDDVDMYYILSRNIIDAKDKDKIEPKLKQILSSTKDEIKKLYREARRSGKDTHSKGGGIGFYEIAKRCDKIEYEFIPLNDTKDRYYFIFVAYVKQHKK
ncbi:MAG: hypothetical protein GXO40_05390 [Epsilonproteobacteria bacterium]|nr:hypothetical protein [Campylobacterota bacterium]